MGVKGEWFARYGVNNTSTATTSQEAEEQEEGGEGRDSMRPKKTSQHPYTIRKLAIAYQNHSHEMPAGRKLEIEQLIRSYLDNGNTSSVESGGGHLLRPGDVERALLAGLGSQRRRKALRCMFLEAEQKQYGGVPQSGSYLRT